jgi:uncharacterized protein (TIGR03435 family)
LFSLKVIATATLSAALLCAQSRAGRRAFDVVSIKQNKDARGTTLIRTPGGLTATDYPLDKLIEMAYETRQIDISRLPDSLRSARFDIIAKASGKISGDQYWEMLQTLLEDRFKLVYHRETKDALVYVLIVDQETRVKKRSDLGPKLSRSENAECPVNPDGRNFCGVSALPGLMNGQRVSMARIARELSPFAGRPVLNQTGLGGSFDFQLTWTPPDQSVSSGDAGKLSAGGDKLIGAGIPFDPSGPSFFSAIQEQLGLKLESKKSQIEILVIEHAEQPSEN